MTLARSTCARRRKDESARRDERESRAAARAPCERHVLERAELPGAELLARGRRVRLVLVALRRRAAEVELAPGGAREAERGERCGRRRERLVGGAAAAAQPPPLLVDGAGRRERRERAREEPRRAEVQRHARAVQRHPGRHERQPRREAPPPQRLVERACGHVGAAHRVPPEGHAAQPERGAERLDVPRERGEAAAGRRARAAEARPVARDDAQAQPPRHVVEEEHEVAARADAEEA